MYKSNFYAKMLPKECTFQKYEPCLQFALFAFQHFWVFRAVWDR